MKIYEKNPLSYDLAVSHLHRGYQHMNTAHTIILEEDEQGKELASRIVALTLELMEHLGDQRVY